MVCGFSADSTWFSIASPIPCLRIDCNRQILDLDCARLCFHDGAYRYNVVVACADIYGAGADIAAHHLF